MADGLAVGGFDHALIGVLDLETARDAYRRLGFTVTPRGRHIGWGTANYCIMFKNDYLELLGIVDAAQFTNNLDKFLDDQGEGLLALSFASADADAAHEHLKGLGATPPKDLKRLLELDEGTVEPRFKLVHLPEHATPHLRAFFCQHLTPQLLRRADWLNHPNGARHIHSATILVEDMAAAERAYMKIFGTGTGTQGKVELPGGGVLSLVSASGARPGPVALAVAVESLDRASGVLDAAGVNYTKDAGGLEIAAEEASGVALSLMAMD